MIFCYAFHVLLISFKYPSRLDISSPFSPFASSKSYEISPLRDKNKYIVVQAALYKYLTSFCFSKKNLFHSATFRFCLKLARIYWNSAIFAVRILLTILLINWFSVTGYSVPQKNSRLKHFWKGLNDRKIKLYRNFR